MKQCAKLTGYYTSFRSKLKHLFADLGLFVLGKSFVRGLDNRSKNSNRIFLSTDYPAVKEHIVHLLADVLRQEDFEEVFIFLFVFLGQRISMVGSIRVSCYFCSGDVIFPKKPCLF